MRSDRVWVVLLPAALVVVFVVVVLLSHRQMSQTYDEGFHLVAGSRYVQCGDFSLNPEHPPLVKMLAGLGLRLTHTPFPKAGACGQEDTSKVNGYLLGITYLYKEGLDAQELLFRGRAATLVFALALMAGLFFYARYLFGYAAGVVALLLAVTEPTLIAHADLVTTDVAACAGILIAVFLLDRHLRTRALRTLVWAGLGVGLAFSVKHSGVLIVPIALVLTAVDAWMRRGEGGGSGKQVLRSAAGLAVILAIGVAVLWATYGFRYWPRPHGAPVSQSLADFLAQVRAQGTTGFLPDVLIPFLARARLLPLAYLYGLTDVLNVSFPGLPPWILGRLLPHGVWYYFPVAFLIKSTPAFLCLLLLSAFAGGWTRPERRRAGLFLLLPVVIWYGAAMTSRLDIGYRHVLPTVPFLTIFVAGGVIDVAARLGRRRLTLVAGALVAAHVASAAVTYPDYFAYSDELLGGKKNTYKYLTDSNNDWGQALYQTVQWLKERGITDCWIAYDGAADLGYYGVPCRVLPGNPWDRQAMPPAEASGTFIVSGLSHAGVEWEPGDLHPYKVFHAATPADVIGGAMLVYRGTFDLRRVQAVSYIVQANDELQKDPAAALRDARAALDLTPTSVRARLTEARALTALGQDARGSFAAGLAQAQRTGADWYPADAAEARRALVASKAR